MKKNIFAMAALLMASAAVFTACSSDDSIADEQPAAPSQPTYTMTIEASKGGPATNRALSLEGKTLNAAWAAGEQVTVYNVTKSAALDGYLEAQSAGASTTLKGSLTGTVEAGDELRLSFLNPVYSAQDGTLAYIASNCDYAVAPVTVASVDGGSITTNAANFANQQAIVKFRLKDTDGNDLNASSLTIAAASNRLLKGQFRNTPETKHTGYTVTAGTGGFGGEGHEKLLDGDKGSKWCAKNGPWNVTFNTASPVQVDGYTLTTGGDTGSESGRNPKNWTLKGKLNESDAWTTIATVTDDNTMPAANTTDVDFVVDKPGSYKYFYFEVTANKGGDIMQLAELQLWKASDATTPIYGPITIFPASATNELTVALHNANGAADTYTLTANVGGQNYTFEKSGVNFVDGKYYEITVKMAAPDPTVTLTPGQIGNLYGGDNKTIGDITIALSGDAHFTDYGTTGLMDVHGDLGPIPHEGGTKVGSFTFTSSAGKIKRIDINHDNGSWNGAGAGWPDSYDVYENGTFTWSGTPAASVTLNGLYDWEHMCSLYNVTSIVFTLEK